MKILRSFFRGENLNVKNPPPFLFKDWGLGAKGNLKQSCT
jgi:hypothetical protein